MYSKTLAQFATALRPSSQTCRAALGILMSWLVIATSGGAAAGPLKPASSGNVYHVSWSITASGSGTTTDGSAQTSWQRSIDIHGSATVKEDPVTGGLITLPFEGTINDNYWEHDTDICQDETINRYIVDPARWVGGPDPFWSAGGEFSPFQRTNGSWYIIDPFYLTFAFSGQLTRYYAYRWDDNYIDTCGGSGSSFNTFTLDRADYTDFFNGRRDLEGDASGTMFTRDETYTVGAAGIFPLTIQYHVTVSLDCAASAANRPAGSSPFAGPT